MEADFCDDLMFEGETTDKYRGIEFQCPYELQPKWKDKDGKTHRAIKYIADFVVHRSDGYKEIIDVKGVQTKTFKLKWKMLQYKFKDNPEYKFKLITKEDL